MCRSSAHTSPCSEIKIIHKELGARISKYLILQTGERECINKMIAYYYLKVNPLVDVHLKTIIL